MCSPSCHPGRMSVYERYPTTNAISVPPTHAARPFLSMSSSHTCSAKCGKLSVVCRQAQTPARRNSIRQNLTTTSSSKESPLHLPHNNVYLFPLSATARLRTVAVTQVLLRPQSHPSSKPEQRNRGQAKGLKFKAPRREPP